MASKASKDDFALRAAIAYLGPAYKSDRYKRHLQLTLAGIIRAEYARDMVDKVVVPRAALECASSTCNFHGCSGCEECRAAIDAALRPAGD